MNIESIRHFFAWCTLINFVLLILWCLLTLGIPSLTGLVIRLFNLDADKFRSLNFAGIMYYKLGIILFNLAPYLALRIIG